MRNTTFLRRKKLQLLSKLNTQYKLSTFNILIFYQYIQIKYVGLSIVHFLYHYIYTNMRLKNICSSNNNNMNNGKTVRFKEITVINLTYKLYQF
jgi:hypothetical protein